MESLERLQSLLRDLFEFEYADLDFGIYRLLRQKRQDIVAFIDEQLPQVVEEHFQGLVDTQLESLKEQASQLATRIRVEIAEDALLGNGEINPAYAGIRVRAAQTLLDQYRTVLERIRNARVGQATRVEVYNHLYAFFSRYYDRGDFVPKRRRGSREAYVIPYDGAETLFHWANAGQYYVKTVDRFRDYEFTVTTLTGEWRVRFALTEASVPKEDLKGDTRFFFPRPDALICDDDSGILTIPFEYRRPTDEELDRYGKGLAGLDAVLREGVDAIRVRVPDPLLAEALNRPIGAGEDEGESILLSRMRHFARRHTADYFVHKDLGGFLRSELEYYVKDQILHAADLEGDFQTKAAALRVFRRIAEDIITFLSEIEDAQRRLFEKAKFVTDVRYLVALGHVPRHLWPEILKNERQLQAWREQLGFAAEGNLFHQPNQVDEELLEQHPTLPVDTAYFDQEFVDALLASFDDLDQAIGGLALHAENFQGLRFLRAKYAGKIPVIFIDPPYNTGGDDFLYKDRYQHSTWLTMLSDRLELAREFLSDDGVIVVSIDDNEQAHLRLLMDRVFGADNFVATVVWQKKYSPQNDATWFSDDHDYLLVYAKDKRVWRPRRLPRSEDQDRLYANPDNDPRGPWMSSDYTSNKTAEERPNLYYPIVNPYTGEEVWPSRNRVWAFTKEQHEQNVRDNRVWWGEHGTNRMPRYKRFLSEVGGVVPRTIWSYDEAGHTQDAAREIQALFGQARFASAKPTKLIERLLQVAPGNIVMDFFAGSGTTAHAVINRNRADGTRRKFILIEMGDHFDSMVVPRLARVMYAPEWRDGRPERLPTADEINATPRIIKIIRLESYEDALHNVAADAVDPTVLERDEGLRSVVGEHAYRLKYLLTAALDGSGTLLSLAKLAHPFSYTLDVLADDGVREVSVDLVETFNALYGVHVERLEVWVNPADGRQYQVVKGRKGDHGRVLILWRDLRNLDPALERQFLEERLQAETGLDRVLINGDCGVPGIQSLDPIFKRLVQGMTE